jgi:hypothetical protein
MFTKKEYFAYMMPRIEGIPEAPSESAMLLSRQWVQTPPSMPAPILPTPALPTSSMPTTSVRVPSLLEGWAINFPMDQQSSPKIPSFEEVVLTDRLHNLYNHQIPEGEEKDKAIEVINYLIRGRYDWDELRGPLRDRLSRGWSASDIINDLTQMSKK